MYTAFIFKLFCLFLAHLYYIKLSKQAGSATVTLGYTVQTYTALFHSQVQAALT